ncbi:MAG: hypothetical protein R2857_00105 [Vampirovibrionales bacterium]
MQLFWVVQYRQQLPRGFRVNGVEKRAEWLAELNGVVVVEPGPEGVVAQHDLALRVEHQHAVLGLADDTEQLGLVEFGSGVPGTAKGDFVYQFGRRRRGWTG